MFYPCKPNQSVATTTSPQMGFYRCWQTPQQQGGDTYLTQFVVDTTAETFIIVRGG